jgi:MFS transporter, NHS family, xanthosine permease
VADKYLSAQKVLGLCHIAAGICIYFATRATSSSDMYWIIFATSLFYMPTIALNNAVSYSILEKNNLDIQKTFTPIRVFGTVGFIIALWITDLMGWKNNTNQFVFAAFAKVLTGIYAFSLPDCPISKNKVNKSLAQRLGLDAFVLFKKGNMALFFLFAMLLGAALQITNMFGEFFIKDFANNPAYKNSIGVQRSGMLISLSQISETLFILTIPFFLKKFGIKKVMLISMIAWALRFGLFGLGNPGSGIILLILSMIVYGMAFDFFNISGSLFIDKEATTQYRSSAQGLFMLVTNGLGAILGGFFAGAVVDYFTVNKIINWPPVWYTFAIYSLIIAVLFALFFKYRHNKVEEVIPSH